MVISLNEKHVQYDQTHKTNWARAILTISTSFVAVNQCIIVVITLRWNTHSNIATSSIGASNRKISSPNHIVNFSCTHRDWVDYFGNLPLQLIWKYFWLKNRTTSSKTNQIDLGIISNRFRNVFEELISEVNEQNHRRL